jgi:hypothetical protein
VPQSVGMFAIKGSTTTCVKHDGAPGGAMIGADVIPIFITPREHTLCFSKYASICHRDFACAKLCQFAKA